jgi:uncharacterized heparinase superfamily protein
MFKDGIEWNQSDLSKLFLYNLHYFDFILREDKDLTADHFEKDKDIFLSWINGNPVGYRNGWESYPLSLRIVNWIFYYNKNQTAFARDDEFNTVFLSSLYRQCAYLSHFLELHIRANHLFKNGKAMLFGGIFFREHKWITIGKGIIDAELDEQILSDGGHFERSPMYHSLILEDIIDLASLVNESKNNNEPITFQRLHDISRRMLKWLYSTIHPDGEIPLFGDSSLKSALTFDQLYHYHNRIFNESPDTKYLEYIDEFKESGYSIFRSPDQFLIMDCGQLGVEYQPGHAHCDMLSYEYSYNNKRFIVDTGIGEYLNTDIRHRARSIVAHNCVVVNNMDQAEIWQTFRMGKRVSAPLVSTEVKGDIIKLCASYNNDLSRKNSFRHEREVLFYHSNFFHIKDHISGTKISSIVSRLNIHPDSTLELNKNTIKLSQSDTSIYILLSEHACNIEINDWFYVPEFGKIIPSKRVEIRPVNLENKFIDYVIVPSDHLHSAEQYFTDLS